MIYLITYLFFCIVDTPVVRTMEKGLYRNYKQFKKDLFLNDLNQIDCKAKLNNLDNDIHQTTKEVINAITEITNKPAPVKVIPHSKSKPLTKPWIPDGILKSMKTKQKMCKTHFHSNNAEKINQYKKYSNRLNKIKLGIKNQYFKSQFVKCKNNIKAT